MPPYPGLPVPSLGRGTARWAIVAALSIFFAIFASPSWTRLGSSCEFFSRIETPVRVFDRSSTCTAPTRSPIGV